MVRVVDVVVETEDERVLPAGLVQRVPPRSGATSAPRSGPPPVLYCPRCDVLRVTLCVGRGCSAAPVFIVGRRLGQ